MEIVELFGMAYVSLLQLATNLQAPHKHHTNTTHTDFSVLVAMTVSVNVFK